MGWTSGDFVFPEKTSLNEMMFEIKDCLDEERGRMEPIYPPVILHNDIKPFESQAEAVKFIREKNYDYDRKNGHGVKFYRSTVPVKSAKLTKLNQQYEELSVKRTQYITEHSVKNQKAAYIGCSVCGSKLSKKHLASERCPLCKADLRSLTVRDRIASFDNRMKEVQKKIEEEEAKISKKSKSRNIFWLVYESAYLG